MVIGETCWRFEQSLLIAKVTGLTLLTNIDFMDSYIESYLLKKMVRIIQYAQRFKGRTLDTVPEITVPQNNIAVSSSLIFDTQENLELFKKEFEKIIHQR